MKTMRFLLTTMLVVFSVFGKVHAYENLQDEDKMNLSPNEERLLKGKGMKSGPSKGGGYGRRRYPTGGGNYPSQSRPGYPSPSRPGGVLTPAQVRHFRERCGCQGALEDNNSSGKGGKGNSRRPSYGEQCRCSDSAELAVLVLFSEGGSVDYGSPGHSMEGLGVITYYNDPTDFDYTPYMTGGQHGSGTVGHPTCGSVVSFKESSTCDYASPTNEPCSVSMIFRIMDELEPCDECDGATMASLADMAQENAAVVKEEESLGFLKENWAAQLTAKGSLGHGLDLLLTGASGSLWKASGQPGFMLHVPGGGMSIWVLPLSDAAACLVNTIITGPPGGPMPPPTPDLTPSPTATPTGSPSAAPSESPTGAPSAAPSPAPSESPTGAPPCFIEVDVTCVTADGTTDCRDAIPPRDPRVVNCLEQVTYMYEFCNIGDNDMTITSAQRVRDGDVSDLLDRIPDTDLSPGECTAVAETENLDLCGAGEIETRLRGEADPPSGSPCFDTDTYTIDPGPV